MATSLCEIELDRDPLSPIPRHHLVAIAAAVTMAAGSDVRIRQVALRRHPPFRFDPPRRPAQLPREQEQEVEEFACGS